MWGVGVPQSWGSWGSRVVQTRCVCGSADIFVWTWGHSTVPHPCPPPSGSPGLGGGGTLSQERGEFANWMAQSVSPCSAALGGPDPTPEAGSPPSPALFPRRSPLEAASPWLNPAQVLLSHGASPLAPAPSANPPLPSVVLTNPVLPPGSATNQSRAATWLCYQPIACCHLALLPTNPMLPPGSASSQSSASTCVPSQSHAASSRTVSPPSGRWPRAPVGTLFRGKNKVFWSVRPPQSTQIRPSCEAEGLPAPRKAPGAR